MALRLPRNAQTWLPGYLKTAFRGMPEPGSTVWLMIADHFEPLWNRVDEATGLERVKRWAREWPRIASRFRDSAGRPPQYTFFFPEEEYRPQFLEPLAEMAHAGIGDVEIHIHHDGEGEADFVGRIRRFQEILRGRHNLLRERDGRILFGFIHGNWALDNSRPDGRWCGLNNEISLLRDLGCYGDFTLPSVPDPAQTRMMNTIYWATDDPARPRSHDRGTPVRLGRPGSGDLLIIPGPMGLRPHETRRWVPRIDTGELAHNNLPSSERIRLWLRLAPRIGDNVFLKLYTHGAKEVNSAALLGGGLERLFELLDCEQRQLRLRFATAWQLRHAINAAALEVPEYCSKMGLGSFGNTGVPQSQCAERDIEVSFRFHSMQDRENAIRRVR